VNFTVAKSGPDLAGVARELERGAQQAQRDAGKIVAAEGRTALLDDVRRSRGSLRMMGGRLGVKTRVTVTTVSSVVELYAAPAGPWAIVVRGTRSYDIEPKRRKVLAAAKGDVVGMHAHRRATTGHDYWGQATDRLDDEIGPLVERASDAAMAKAAG
jgi:hypothetical protein